MNTNEISQAELDMVKERARSRLIDHLMVHESALIRSDRRRQADALLPGVLAALERFSQVSSPSDEEIDMLSVAAPGDR